MNEVFLSYTWSKNRHDEINDFHERLQNDFQNKCGDTAATIFLDKQNLHGGDAFDEVIENELEDCKLLLILISPTWLNSDYCNKEYRIFKAHGNRPIIPVLWDTIIESQIKEEYLETYHELKKLNWITWDELQYENWESTNLKKATGKLAAEINFKILSSNED